METSQYRIIHPRREIIKGMEGEVEKIRLTIREYYSKNNKEVG
jgi:hypothetical protein